MADVLIALNVALITIIRPLYSCYNQKCWLWKYMAWLSCAILDRMAFFIEYILDFKGENSVCMSRKIFMLFAYLQKFCQLSKCSYLVKRKLSFKSKEYRYFSILLSLSGKHKKNISEPQMISRYFLDRSSILKFFQHHSKIHIVLLYYKTQVYSVFSFEKIENKT